MDASVLLGQLYPALNAATAADLIWWTSDDLYARVDECAKHLARKHLVFLATDSTAVNSQITYPLASGAIEVIHASWANVMLRPTTVAELEALDCQWQTTLGNPKRWTLDLGLGNTRLYPTLPANLFEGDLERISAYFPPLVNAAQLTLAIPIPVEGYVYQWVLASARDVEGEAKMPEVVEHAQSRLALYEKVFESYWGGGQ